MATKSVNEGLNFKDDIFSFYRFVTPIDMLGQMRLTEAAGSAEGSKAASKKKLTSDASNSIMDLFVDKFSSGFNATTRIKAGPEKIEQEGNLLKNIKGIKEYCQKGFFKACYQPSSSPSAEYTIVGDSYFMHQKPASDPKNKSTQLTKITNFYAEVCGGASGADGQPPAPIIDLTVALMRAPMLSAARRNTHEIELYLNAMPPTFANELVPYCEVEFQLPLLKTQNQGTNEYVNRPSLYRFLVGSGESVINLSESDKALAYSTLPNDSKTRRLQREQQKGSTDPTKSAERDVQLNQSKTAFFGMEMFTSPQTLVNMDRLKRTNGGVPTRLNDAKPFLPPATIQSVSITLQNAGAGTFGKKNAGLTMVIHDKARLAEFAEFLRGQSGYNEATVWITYGMLAPRNRGEFDAYAKFINKNFLVRDAFVVSNTQFTFNQDGSVAVNLTMATKALSRLDVSTITFGGSIESKKRELKQLVEKIQTNAKAWGKEREEKAGFSQAEVRFSSIIESAAAAEMDPGIAQDELKKIFDEVQTVLEAAGKDGKDGKAAKSKRVPGMDVAAAKNLVADLRALYLSADKPDNKNKGNDGTAFQKQLRAAGKNYADNLLKAAADRKASPDPFFPEDFKNLTKDGTPLPDGIKLFTDDLIQSCAVASKGQPDRRYVSFGKLFCLFCVPALLNSIAEEFGWSRELTKTLGGSSCPEVQFIFYQLNRKCGPVSGHNIAEFPMDITMFSDSFAKLIEATGGDNMPLSAFLEFINEQFEDFRQPGYGRKDFYKEYESGKPDAVPKPAQNPANTTKEFNGNLEKWAEQYGSSFIPPVLSVDMEVAEEDGNATGGKIDLLAGIANRIGGGAEPQFVPSVNKKTIIKFHIYDRACSPYEEVADVLRQSSDGKFYMFDSEDDAANYTAPPPDEASPDSPTSPTTTTIPRAQRDEKQVTVAGQTLAVGIGTGKNALKQFIGSVVPVIEVGANGSLITNIQLQSKTDSLQGTIALQGGTQKLETSLTSTGLSQEMMNMPMILFPAQLTMTTLGCPIAVPYQQFFVDFGTNTTLDNCYNVTQIAHSFAPGKFETNWTLGYYDGYGRMINAGKISDTLVALKKAVEAPAGANVAPTQTTPGQPAK